MRGEGKLIKKVRLNLMNGKVVVGWTKGKDEVYFDEQGRLHETQTIKLYYYGGEDKEPSMSKELDYRSFHRIKVQEEVEVIEESKDKDGNTNFVVVRDDGSEIKIDSRFIN